MSGGEPFVDQNGIGGFDFFFFIFIKNIWQEYVSQLLYKYGESYIREVTLNFCFKLGMLPAYFIE